MLAISGQWWFAYPTQITERWHVNLRRRHPLLFTITTLLVVSSITVESLLLSDLSTPCFVIDTQALKRISIAPNAPNDATTNNINLPSIRLPESGKLFRPYSLNSQNRDDALPSTEIDVTFPMEEGMPSIGFLHSSVTRAREDVTPQDDPATFLAELDLDTTLSGGSAKLVLGLNNHHVGGYYWARSAGAGASMEAPGVSFESCHSSDNRKGVLRWLDAGGAIGCNSNDGKRSEWVNFLRKGDTVQLVPMNGQEAMLQMSESFDAIDDCRVFGISAEGRPMGSEPKVVCEWRRVT